MTITVGFSEAKSRWSEVTNKVMDEKKAITVIKNNKPAFVLVPISEYAAMTKNEPQKSLIDIAEEVDSEYHDVFEELA